MGVAERVPSSAEFESTLDQWATWITDHTDTLLALDERARVAGTPGDQADIAAAFVARKALALRLDEIRAQVSRDRRAAAALTAAPVVDDLGGPVGNDLADAANLLDAVLQRVAGNLDRAEADHADDLRLRAVVADQLALAQRLSALLGSQVNRVAKIADRVAAAGRGEDEFAAIAGPLQSVAAELESAAAHRVDVLDRLQRAAEHIENLRSTEVNVRELVARCREKVLQAPNLAVPSVDALGETPVVDPAAGEPWVATLGRVQPWLDRVERVGAALEFARTKFQAALDERDQQRGLLQAFRDKAAAHGFGEHQEIEPLYRAAEEVLWSAPCDLVAAAPMVQLYILAVNAKVSS